MLNIKNEEAHRLAKQLATVTGESIATAVKVAIRERLERVSQKAAMSKAERILQIGRDCAAHMKEPYRSIDHGEMLYDEKGLPK